MLAIMRHAMFALLTCAWCACAGSPEATGDAAAAVDAGGDYVLPAGTTLTPFLSTDPERTFAAAGTATVAGKDYFAVIETPEGRIVLDLLEDQTPITVNSFVWLALHHF